MFTGTGTFREHLCPHLRVASKSSSAQPSSPDCTRPHCKYSHDLVAFPQERQNGLSQSPPVVNKAPTAVPDLPRQPSSESPSPVQKLRKSPEKSTVNVEKADEDVDSVDLFEVSSTISPEIPSFADPDSTADVVDGAETTSLIPAVIPSELVPDRPTYSDAPCSEEKDSEDDNPYLVILNEMAKPSQPNDMEYDPHLNWKLPFQSQIETPPTTPLPQTLHPDQQSASGSSASRNRLLNEPETVVALGQKFTGKNALPNKSVLTKSQLLAPGIQPVSSSSSAAQNQPNSKGSRKSSQPSSGSETSKPVRKKARFGKAAEDEEAMDVDLVVQPPVKRSKSLTEKEVLQNLDLFGEDDEDDDADDSTFDLPTEMDVKAAPPPKGFPKNQQNLLQTMQARTEQAKPVVRPVANNSPQRPLPIKKKPALNPQQQLEARRRMVEEQQKAKQLTTQKSLPAGASLKPSTSAGSLINISDGKRVAHQPAASAVAAAAAPRIAVIPGNKLNAPFRQQVLEKFIQYLKQIYKHGTEAVDRAIMTEKNIATTSFQMTTYRSRATQELYRLKIAAAPTLPPAVPSSSSAASSSSSKVPVVLPGAPKQQVSPMQAQKANYSVVQRPNTIQRSVFADPKSWTDQDFYLAIKKFVLNEDQLVMNGYPLIQTKKQDGENTRNGLQLYIAMSGKITPDRITQTRRVCCRCKKNFTVDFEGNYAKEEDCVYHWGKPFSRRIAGEGIASRRSCCSSEDSSAGCSVASNHVTDTIPSLSGFVSTSGISAKTDEKYRVYAIDCEMIYTVGGMEVARVTVVDRSLKCVYESLIRPKQRIVDCNTRFSGLKMEQFGRDKNLKTIEDVHKDLVGSLINEDTILVGHSLESDLLALKLIHRNIVDTSIVFPHKRGPPFKRALRNLMREILQRIIQEDAGGHDSREDAAACMELMVWKIKQDRGGR